MPARLRRRIIAILVVVVALASAQATQAQVIGPGPIFRSPGRGPRQPPEGRPRPRPPVVLGICQSCADPADFAAPLPPSGSCYFVRDGLDGGGDCDWVSFPVTRLELYSAPSCALVAQTVGGDFCSATGARLVYTPPVAGVTYRLRVAGVAGQVGPYTLTYREAP